MANAGKGWMARAVAGKTWIMPQQKQKDQFGVRSIRAFESCVSLREPSSEGAKHIAKKLHSP
jgi:hypothetical protein